MNFVAVDFSLNSPGICIFNNKTLKYHFISYIKEKNGTKKELKIQDEIALLEDVTLVKQPDFAKSKDYSSAELLKIRRYNIMSRDMMALIKDHIVEGDPTIISFEGTSYGSKMGTNNLVDMSAGAAILKNKMLNELNPTDILTIAPTSLKKFVKKGNMKKIDIWDCFIVNEYLKDSELLQYAKAIGGNLAKVPKPLDDLVDAFYLSVMSHTIDIKS